MTVRKGNKIMRKIFDWIKKFFYVEPKHIFVSCNDDDTNLMSLGYWGGENDPLTKVQKMDHCIWHENTKTYEGWND